MSRRAILFLVVGVVASIFFVMGLWLGIASKEKPVVLQPVEFFQVVDDSKLAISDLDGNAVTAAFATGPLLLNFWASWCPPCLKELPLLNEIAQRCPDKVVGFVLDERSNGQRIASELGLSFPSYLTEPGFAGIDLMPKLGNDKSVMPYSILIDSEGMVLKGKSGEFKNVAEIEQFMGDIC